jgi:hypothetical protein
MTKAKTSAVPSIPVGSNIEMRVVGEEVTLRIDLTADFGPSASGKSRKVASSGGNTTILGGLKMGVNCYDSQIDRKLTAADVPDSPEMHLGTNVVSWVKGGALFIRFDSGQDFGPTKSGKSRTVASTGGNTTVAAGLKLGVNVYDPTPAPRA